MRAVWSMLALFAVRQVAGMEHKGKGGKVKKTEKVAVDHLQPQFNAFDRNGDGNVDLAELLADLANPDAGATAEQQQAVARILPGFFIEADEDGNGRITLEEFPKFFDSLDEMRQQMTEELGEEL
eukprot:TRINITY_DN26959_c0_g1_i1.p1 TRINITY_DN26959_c0_g1~~TRINITY_DN26959_c0_g1_i1.p1  ORF type:complete len:125 (-),score=44.77 TRINITY_DN26959_c0_g1_i1:69-443(-)